jgi:threonylcarbamoyladenosine tRNA methylthiotransferase MtaB
MRFFGSLPLTYFHVFPYSARRGTIAAALPDQLPVQLKKERSRKMRELGARKKEEFSLRFRGRSLPVLLEEKLEPANGRHRGFSRNYLPVLVSGGGPLVNREVEVEIEGFERGWLLGNAAAAASARIQSDERVASNAT